MSELLFLFRLIPYASNILLSLKSCLTYVIYMHVEGRKWDFDLSKGIGVSHGAHMIKISSSKQGGPLEALATLQ